MYGRNGTKLFGICSTIFLLGLAPSWAQLDLRIETPKASYLQFSPIPFTVRIKNLGASELRLTENQGKPWLEMIIQSRDGQLIAPEKTFLPPDKTLRPGQSASLVRNVRTVRVDGGGCEWLMRVGLEKHKHDHAGHGDIQPDRKRDACEAAVLSEPLAEAQE